MTNHLIYALYMFSLISGITVSIVFYLFYYRYRKPEMRAYFRFIFSLTMLIMVYTVIIYLQVYNNEPRVYPDAGFIVLTSLAETSTGSSTRIARALVMAVPPSLENHEITVKGNLNVRKVQQVRKDLVERLYNDNDPAVVKPEKRA